MKPLLLVAPGFIPFLPDGIDYITSFDEIKSADYAIFWFPAKQNIAAMIRLRLKFHSKIVYVFHEPIESYSTYIKSGNSHVWTIQFYLKYCFSLIFLLLSHKVILPSNKALKMYDSQICRLLNKNRCYLPLLYYDEAKTIRGNRKYISYIGTISKDHAFDKYIDMIYYLFKENCTEDSLCFQIATRFNVERDNRIQEMIEANRLIINDGHPLSDEEINEAYSSSYMVWNAYHRTTQSGVMAKAFMFGTPAIVLKKNLSEFMTDRGNVFACENNSDLDSLKVAVIYIYNHFEEMSKTARDTFMRCFDYKNHNVSMKKLLESIQ